MKHFDSFELAKEKHEKHESRTVQGYGYGASSEAMALIQKHFNTAYDVVLKKLNDSSRSSMKGIADTFSILSPEKIALVAFQGGLHCIADEMDLQDTNRYLGDLMADELYAAGLVAFDEKLALNLDKRARKNSNAQARKTSLKVMAGKNGYYFDGFASNEERDMAGAWLTEVLMELDDVFVLVRPEEGEDYVQPHLTLTEGALVYAQEFTKAVLEKRPVALPQLSMPPAWEGMYLTLESNGRQYKVPLIRRSSKSLSYQHLKAAIKAGTAKPVLDALTAASQVAWSINAPVLEMVKWAYLNNVAVKGLPTKQDEKLPAKLADDVWAAMSEEEQKAAKKERSDIRAANRALIGLREVYNTDVSTAEILLERGNRFWTPMNMDYRGRVYGCTYFHFQRQDYVRAMFLFADGVKLGHDGLRWLMIHLANCGDFDKVSKKPFAERVEWVNENINRILEMAADPTQDLWWTEADKPFMFLAAAIDLRNALLCPIPCEYVSHLPVSFDGTCSGLQHFAAMTRCDQTAPLVNLTNNERPSDVYQAVANVVKAKVALMAQDPDHEFHEVANLILGDIDRGMVKRNVMTWAYSAKRLGMMTQVMEDTMQPLQHKVVTKRLKLHPYQVAADTFTPKNGKTEVCWPGWTAAKMLGGTTYDSIGEVVKRPQEAMEFLQKIARATAHEGKPVIWTTPMGMPVVLHYPNHKSQKLRLWMMDRGVRFQVQQSNQEQSTGIDKNAAANAVAPSFVHSYDACHLQMVVYVAAKKGIKDVALVHDSFGCHAGKADAFRKVVSHTFCYLYRKYDVLSMVLEENKAQLLNHERLPKREEVSTGSYQIRDVLRSFYAFA
ncbi:DNA-directed RNA polymerase [Microvirga flocculans]|uniref:DNA-directed RNA polymerase n=1 Tax=Microvirga flocculans TaxID=217168 RepID=A0A7W6ICX0_9HYPH|nr:DNA-directed RNA polymerase [Microvirga flocculans]MBB4039142.1 DNA-directed RNA polymerase [Microvirga flocculans]